MLRVLMSTITTFAAMLHSSQGCQRELLLAHMTSHLLAAVVIGGCSLTSKSSLSVAEALSRSRPSSKGSSRCGHAAVVVARRTGRCFARTPPAALLGSTPVLALRLPAVGSAGPLPAQAADVSCTERALAGDATSPTLSRALCGTPNAALSGPKLFETEPRLLLSASRELWVLPISLWVGRWRDAACGNNVRVPRLFASIMEIMNTSCEPAAHANDTSVSPGGRKTEEPAAMPA